MPYPVVCSIWRLLGCKNNLAFTDYFIVWYFDCHIGVHEGTDLVMKILIYDCKRKKTVEIIYVSDGNKEWQLLDQIAKREEDEFCESGGLFLKMSSICYRSSSSAVLTWFVFIFPAILMCLNCSSCVMQCAEEYSDFFIVIKTSYVLYKFASQKSGAGNFQNFYSDAFTGTAKRECTEKNSWLEADLSNCTSDNFTRLQGHVRQHWIGVSYRHA